MRSCCTAGGSLIPRRANRTVAIFCTSSDEGGLHSWDKVCPITGEMVALPLCPGRWWVTAGDLLASHGGASCHLNFSSPLHLSRL